MRDVFVFGFIMGGMFAGTVLGLVSAFWPGVCG